MANKHFESQLLTGGILYGPFHARRRGTVVGVNLLPNDVKICNFDCVYCHCGLTDAADLKRLDLCPPIEAVDRALEEGLRELAARNVALDTIIISGNGEPTLYPRFSEAVNVVEAARTAHAATAKIAALTNGTLLHKPSVAVALTRVDARVVKFDAGPADLFDAIDRPVYGFGFKQLLQGVKALPDFALQSIFLAGSAGDNTTDAAVDEWIAKVRLLKPLYVEIYGLDRLAPVPGVEKVPLERLRGISHRLASRTGIEGRVYE